MTFQRRQFLAAALGLPLAGLSLSVAARPALADDLKAALDDLAKARGTLKTMVAPFTQTRSIGLLSSDVKSTGELTLVRPDKLRWELFPPDATTYWIVPEGIFVKSATSGKAQKAPAGAGGFSLVLSDIMTFLGGDLSTLTQRYDLSCPSREGGITLVAIPKSEQVKKALSRLEIKTTPELWAMSKVTIDEPSGDKSVIVFGKSVRDVAVDSAKMKPPA